MTGRTRKVGFSAAAGTGDQQVLVSLDPVALCQPGDDALFEVARVAIVYLVNAGAELELRLVNQPVLFAVVAYSAFPVKQ